MTVEFLNSEFCKVDGKDMILFKDPLALLKQIENTLKKIGPEKFFSSTDENVKKVRESMASFFFVAGINKYTGKYWWLMQPNDTFPDFIFMAVENDPLRISLEQVELVEVPPRCQTFEEMKSIVEGKINKGYPENCNLLIFVNHEKSQGWINSLYWKLEGSKPFKTIWTVHLLFQNKNEAYASVVNKIRPEPIHRVNVSFNDPSIFKFDIPDFLEETKRDGKTFLNFKPDFATEFTKTLRKLKLSKK